MKKSCGTAGVCFRILLGTLGVVLCVVCDEERRRRGFPICPVGFFFFEEERIIHCTQQEETFPDCPKCRSDRCNNGAGAAALEMWDIRFLGYTATGVRGWTIDNFADHNWGLG
jgi:hypothetical protein